MCEVGGLSGLLYLKCVCVKWVVYQDYFIWSVKWVVYQDYFIWSVKCE